MYFHFSALCDVRCEPDSFIACGCNLCHDFVDPVFTPQSQDDLRSVLRKKLRSAFSKTAASSGDY